MNTLIKDGGPAFPFTPNPQPRNHDGTWCQNWDTGEQGMSLRDWFAGRALTGLCAHPEFGTNEATWLAEASYEQADAMLKARETQAS